MTYKLFIDDERYPASPGWIRVTDSCGAIYEMKKRGCPFEIAFDHDLGGEDTSMVIINWMIESYLDGKLQFPDNFNYSIHSQNPVGAANIESKMKFLLQYVRAQNFTKE